jgi:hypothetical protein
MPGEFEGSGAGESGGFDMAGAVSEVAAGLGFGGSDNGNADASDTPSDTGSTTPAGDDGAAVEQSSAGSEGAKGDAPGEHAADATGQPATTPAPAPTEDLTQPPKTWRKEATAGWETLPEGVRAEIHKREGDMYRGLEQYKSGAEFGWEIAGMFKPYEQIMSQAGVAPQQIIPGLLNAHATLAMGNDDAKLDTLQRIVKDYAIPLPKLLAKLTGGALDDVGPYVDPQVKALQEKLDGLQFRLSQQDQVAAQAKQAEIQRSVQDFASDPKNVYFGELADDIALLIRSGVTKDLKVAYEKALWANPAVRAKEQARIAAEAESERTRKAAEAAAKARVATAANVRSTARSGGPTAAKTTSLDDTLERTLAEIQARG